jgi:hypothetical protein
LGAVLVGLKGDQPAAAIFEGTAEAAVETKPLPIGDVVWDGGAYAVGSFLMK